MLSRLALRSPAVSASQSRACLALISSRDLGTSPKLQERDLVNFPRRVRPIEKPPVALGFIPQEWFDALYPKTGVTGPYVALVGAFTFLASKEFYVLEHDFYVGLGLIAVLTTIIKAVGPDYTASINQQMDKEENELRMIRQGEIDAFKQQIADTETAIANGLAWEDIIKAKKEAVGLQLEAEYRDRLAQAHAQVKKRLDYQLETANVMRRMEQKHMVDWIISSVKKSITPAQETAALKKCISDLKGLAAA